MLPHLLLLTTVIMWGSTFVATKILLAELGPVEILALRLAVGLPVVTAILLVRRQSVAFTRADLRPLLAGGAIFTLHVVIQVTGLLTTSATNTGWIISVSPLAMAILSYLFLRERIGRGVAVGIAVATAGILLLVSHGRLTALDWLRSTGDWLVLLSAFTWAAYTVVTRDLARRRDPLAVTLGVFTVAATLTAVLAITTGDFSNVSSLSPGAIAALLYLAIPAQVLGQWFWHAGVAQLGATRAGLYLYLEPLSTVAVAVPLLGEPFGAITAVGGALVLSGVYFGQRGRRALAEG